MTEIVEENSGAVPIQEEATAENPFAYLERGEFSSEGYKIEIKNLPKYYGISEIRKLLNLKLKLNSSKIKLPRRNSHYMFVCFRNDDDRDNAIAALNDYKWKGSVLKAMKAKPSPDPLVRKRNAALEDEGSSNCKKPKLDEKPLEERLKDSTIPYWNIPYNEQLKLKQEEVRNILKKFGNDLSRSNPEIKLWLENQQSKHGGLPCELLDIRFATQQDEYRNKCEFSVGINEENNLPTVGFRSGSYVNGVTNVGPVEHLKHIPKPMKLAVKLFEEFVRQSELEVFNPELQTGHFKQLCIRSAPEQLMVVVGIHPQDLSKEDLDKFKQALVGYFSEGGGKDAKVTSLYYQAITKKLQGELITPSEHLWGETHIYETILGLKFRISPEAFFQINTPAAEILYSAAIELASPTSTSTVLDVCCGTGTIGLCFSKQCGQVLGLEIVPQAIIDAKENATINEIENSEFFTGKAQEILGSVCFKASSEEVIAVVDPPRAGLHMKAVSLLRKIPKIQKVIYVSCNANAAMKNFLDMGRPESKTLHGEAFVPVKAVAVDMFPHTKHCELVICFERWDKISKEFENNQPN